MDFADVRAAYDSRAEEYIGVLGSVDHSHEADRTLIERWAVRLPEGPVIDAGCGPGHWTAFLDRRGIQVEGVDLVPGFIDSARARFPDVPFWIGSIDHLGFDDHGVSGVLAWYSLIHSHPEDLFRILGEFARVLRPGGGLLLGFFEGPAATPFSHAVVEAYYWSVEVMEAMLDGAGLKVVEAHRRHDPGKRPHAAMVAVSR